MTPDGHFFLIKSSEGVESNSLIEAFFHQLKNRYLYFQDISTFEILVKHIDFYVKENNEVIPFLSIGGVTPLQAYTVPESTKLNKVKNQEMTKEAIQKRIKFRQNLTCANCK